MSERVKIKEIKVLSDNWYILRKITYDYLKNNGEWQPQVREAYDRGNGAAILLYNKTLKTVVLVRQFRMPILGNSSNDGMLIEACAGVLDDLQPEECIKKEVEEETGFVVNKVEKVFDRFRGGIKENG